MEINRHLKARISYFSAVLHISLVILFGQVSAQNTWEVIKIRGNIWSGPTLLRVGSKINKTQCIGFTNTSDVMLLRRGEEYYFLKPENFSFKVTEGVTLKNQRTTIKESQKYHLFATVSENMTIISNFDHADKCVKYRPKLNLGRCYEILIDSSWARFEITESDERYYYPPLGYKWNYSKNLTSPNCLYRLIFQDASGSFILENKADHKVLWSSQTTGIGQSCELLESGNLVIYDSKKRAVWASSTWSKDCKCSYLLLTDDGNLKIVAPNGQTKWETRTWGGTVNTNPLGHIVSAKKFTFDPRARYRISSAMDDRPLDVNMTTETKGIPVLTQNASNKNTQQWSIIRTLDLPYYQLKSNQIYYLGVLPNGKNQLQLSLFDNTPNQQWDIAPAEEDGLFYIRNVIGLYLETLGNKGVQLSPFTGEKKQQWKFEPIK